jgi:hypothetical protein
MGSIPDNQSALTWNFYNNPRQPYDDFVVNYIFKPLKFTFVQRHYDRPLSEFIRELPEVMHHFTTVFGPGGGSAWLEDTIGQIQEAGAANLYTFLDRVTTRSLAQVFLKISNIPQPCLMAWMDYLKQWWFPFPATLRQLADEGNPALDAALAQLKAVRIANCMTMLEAAAEPDSRTVLARQLGIAEAVLLDLVHRADVSRLPYTSGGAVKRLWVMGYRSLAAIRTADPQDYAARIEVYFAAGGKGSSFDSRLDVIQGFLADARHAPDVVKTT